MADPLPDYEPIIQEDDAPKSAGALIPRATIESIVTQRNVALDRFDDVYHSLVSTNEKIRKAHEAAMAAAPNRPKHTQHLSLIHI